MIEFKKIIIEGFCSIGTLELPLNNNGITSIKGANGLGKTTIFSALVWVLYGKTLKQRVTELVKIAHPTHQEAV